MKKTIYTFVILLLIIILIPLTILLGPHKLRYYGLKELVYKTITTQVTEDAKNEQEKVLSLFNYVHQRLYPPFNTSPTDVDQLHNLVRNAAWCDSQVGILIALAQKIGLEGGWAYFDGGDPKVQIGHAFGVLHIDGKYRMLDPTYGFVFINEDGTLATIEDISTHHAQLKSKQHEALKWLMEQGLNNIGFGEKKYIRLFDHPENKRIMPLTWPGFQRKLVSNVIDLYYEAFGEGFLTFFEELYFLIDDTPHFLKARLKQVSFRYESAVNDYDNILRNKSLAENSSLLLLDYDNISDEIVASEVIFFKGMAFWENKDFAQSVEIFEYLLEEYPDSRWVGLIHFYLGDSYEKLNEIEKAINSYEAITIDIKPIFADTKARNNLVEKIPQTPAAMRLRYLIQVQG